VHLVYGAEDWDAVDKSANIGGKPRHDVSGDDGMTISVGDVSLRIVSMPGHTPGTLSYLFEIRDNGKPLRVAYVGGTAIPFNADAHIMTAISPLHERWRRPLPTMAPPH